MARTVSLPTKTGGETSRLKSQNLHRSEAPQTGGRDKRGIEPFFFRSKNCIIQPNLVRENLSQPRPVGDLEDQNQAAESWSEALYVVMLRSLRSAVVT